MKRVLLTGGTGFVGANLARRLLAEGCQVHLLVRPGYQPWRVDEIRGQIKLHVVRLTERAEVNRLVRSVRPDWIFHLSAHGAYSWQIDVQQMIQTNFIETTHLLQASLAQGFEAFIHTGSSSEYGFKDHPPAEEEALEPNSYYAVTKASASLYCQFAARQNQAPVRVLRLYSVYGPYEEPNRLMPNLVLAGLRGELPALVNPETARDYVFVEDVCDAYLSAASQPGQQPGAAYNVGTGAQTPLREVVAAARRLLKIQAEPVWGSMPERTWDTSIWVANTRKIRAELHWQPHFSLEQGLSAMIDWFRAQPELWPRYQSR